jgi:hypothetical protein
MKGFIRTTAAGLCLSAGSLTLVGCAQYRAHVDPCWPERYDAESRQVIRTTFDNQAANGHLLDQTIWNWDFERDDKGNPSDKLTPGAQERLKYIVRRRPVPDGKLYLQTANDLPATVEIEKFASRRQEVDAARVAAVQKYLGAYMAGRSTPVAWDIAVHDLAPVGLPATVVGGQPGVLAVTGAYPKLANNFQGVMGSATGFTITSGGGGGGTGGGGTGAGGQQGQGQGAGASQQGAGSPPSQ